MNIDFSKYKIFKTCKNNSIKLLPKQGFSNKNYIFKCKNRKYLLRNFILQDIDRELEFNIQSLVSKESIAAKPFLIDHSENLMICEFLEGEHRKKLSREDIKKTVYILKCLHSLKTDFNSLKLETLFSIKSSDVKEAFATINKYPKEMALCHNDLNYKNFIFSKKGLKLIDWEFAGVNDIYFDLAAVSIEFNFTILEEAYFLASYFLMDGWEKEKLEAYKVIYKSLCKQWFEDNLN